MDNNLDEGISPFPGECETDYRKRWFAYLRRIRHKYWVVGDKKQREELFSSARCWLYRLVESNEHVQDVLKAKRELPGYDLFPYVLKAILRIFCSCSSNECDRLMSEMLRETRSCMFSSVSWREMDKMSRRLPGFLRDSIWELRVLCGEVLEVFREIGLLDSYEIVEGRIRDSKYGGFRAMFNEQMWGDYRSLAWNSMLQEEQEKVDNNYYGSLTTECVYDDSIFGSSLLGQVDNRQAKIILRQMRKSISPSSWRES